ncbi:xanthine dehydrogenase accessory factor [Actinopolyspora xinjiangensis]|uniref:Xanthine dehydrogenase accessory factor n=1 Tax=Actinopolyspora xinjiangensis TaxID=405564 RepID=A0A1H0W3L9_9ACTN|nr:XdhC/CoxI family protein [Actinopolyspora xinjiangensis]SDP85327.1 xanthine dehydrogenase accessory factor [Actinopolyspora xinjiangensis]
MREIADELLRWIEAGERFVVASIVGVRGSAPRDVGATAAVHSDGTVLGSLSGGCVEGAVYSLATRALSDGEPLRTSFDHDPDDPFAVGLTCGGELDVYLHPVDPADDSPAGSGGTAAALSWALRSALRGEPVAVARMLDSGRTLAVGAEEHVGGTGIDELDGTVLAETRAMLGQDVSGTRRLCVPGGREHPVFVESWNTPPRMLVFGAIDHAAALARMGKFLGYHVTVCDARPVFTTRERFPEADEVVVRWPHEYLAEVGTDQRSVVCVLTHDAKFDVPVLREALRRPAGYVGALGSRRTHADRLDRLRAAGLTEPELERLRAPIGLDLGGRTPEETAVSIAAEIVALRNSGSARPLTRTSGPIHVA